MQMIQIQLTINYSNEDYMSGPTKPMIKKKRKAPPIQLQDQPPSKKKKYVCCDKTFEKEEDFETHKKTDLHIIMRKVDKIEKRVNIIEKRMNISDTQLGYIFEDVLKKNLGKKYSDDFLTSTTFSCCFHVLDHLNKLKIENYDFELAKTKMVTLLQTAVDNKIYSKLSTENQIENINDYVSLNSMYGFALWMRYLNPEIENVNYVQLEMDTKGSCEKKDGSYEIKAVELKKSYNKNTLRVAKDQLLCRLKLLANGLTLGLANVQGNILLFGEGYLGGTRFKDQDKQNLWINQDELGVRGEKINENDFQVVLKFYGP